MLIKTSKRCVIMAATAIAFAAMSMSTAATLPHQGADALGIDFTGHVEEPVCDFTEKCTVDTSVDIAEISPNAIGETAKKPNDASLLTLTDNTGTIQLPSEPGMWKSLTAELVIQPPTELDNGLFKWKDGDDALQIQKPASDSGGILWQVASDSRKGQAEEGTFHYVIATAAIETEKMTTKYRIRGDADAASFGSVGVVPFLTL